MIENVEAGFELDPRLAADAAFVADWHLCRVLLMDDARFPWLVLVPRRAHLVELDDVHHCDQALLMRELHAAVDLLREIGPCDKLNIGMLGNIVRQLHVHVVARREGDAAWPGPVWGSGVPLRYEPAARGALIQRLSNPPAPDPGEIPCIMRRCRDS